MATAQTTRWKEANGSASGPLYLAFELGRSHRGLEAAQYYRDRGSNVGRFRPFPLMGAESAGAHTAMRHLIA